MAKFKKLVLTGAAGRLGSYLREPLSQMCEDFVSTDIVKDIGNTYANETFVSADIADLSQMEDLLKGADMVIHFGAICDEAPFETLLGPNFIGAYNIWEAAYRNNVRRVVYASSIHAVGMYPKTVCLTPETPHKPDTFYGLAKCFAEDLASMYWDKRQIEAVCLRIYSAAQVNNARSLGTWLSYDDLIQLVTRAVDTPYTGFSIVYGISNNDRAPVDNSQARFLGYQPKDNAEIYAQDILANEPPVDVNDKGQTHHGGPFAKVELGNSGLAHMNIVDDKKTS